MLAKASLRAAGLFPWLCLSAVMAAEQPALRLEQALEQAAQHPRTRLKQEALQSYPLRQPLYLDCHALAYTNSSRTEPQRDAALTALLDPVEQQRLEILQRFFDVLLADASAARDTENQAVYYIPLDRARTRLELKQFSEADVARLDAEYQVVRQQTAASIASQRLTRTLLAQALNNPQQLPGELQAPALSPPPAEWPSLDALFQTSLQNNRWLQAVRERAGTDERTVLEGELRLQLLELLLRLDIFRVGNERIKADTVWNDLYLERSRTLYEQEVNADLGDAMTRQSQTHLQQQQLQFCQALTLAQLNALQGKPVWPVSDPTQPEKTK